MMRDPRPIRRLHACVQGIVAACACAWLAACHRGTNDPAGHRDKSGDTAPPRSVKVQRAKIIPIERSISVVGSLVAQDQATLSMKVPGRILRVHVDLGSTVKTGDLLAEVEPLDFELKLRQAAATLSQARARLGLPLEGTDDSVVPDQTSTVKQARAKLEEAIQNKRRVDELSKQGIISKSEVDSAEAHFEVAQNQHVDAVEEVRLRQALLAQRRVEDQIARQQLVDTKIHAPFDGAVQERRAHLGEFLAAGAPVVTLVRTEPLRFRTEISERNADRVRVGQTVRLTVDGDPRPYSGLITRLSPSIGAANRMLVAEADVPNPGNLRPGSFARGEIVLPNAERALVVPAASVATFAGIERVYAVAGQKIAERFITTGQKTSQWIEVLSGLKEGEAVAVEGAGLKTGLPAVAVE